MCIKNTHLKCLKSYYRISRVEVTHLFLECNRDYSFYNSNGRPIVTVLGY